MAEANETSSLSSLLSSSSSIISSNVSSLVDEGDSASVDALVSSSSSSTVASVVGLINATVSSALSVLNSTVDGDVPFSSSLNDTQSKLRVGVEGEDSAAPVGDQPHGHSSTTLTAWIGLGILLIGIVFVLGFVFVYDRFIRKKFFGKEEEEEEEGEPKPNGKGPKETAVPDLEKGLDHGGQQNGPPEPGQQEMHRASSQTSLGSNKSANRKRQEKQDEQVDVVELKRLDNNPTN